MSRLVRFSVIVLVITVLATTAYVQEKEKPFKPLLTNVGEILKLLEEAQSEPVVLKGDDKDKLVIVAPRLVGRVMTTSLDGLAGETNASIGEAQIKAGCATSGYAATESWNNFGGMERLWFAPEGGEFGFFFPPGTKEQSWENYKMSYPLHEIAYKTIDKSADGKSVAFWAPIRITNCRGVTADVGITRQITILESCPYAVGYGDKIEAVGFESKSFAKNLGVNKLDKDKIPFSLWTVGNYNSGKQVILLLPFKTGPASELGEPVTKAYFPMQSDFPGNEKIETHWTIKDGCVLIKSDGQAQAKIEMFKRRSIGRLASIDLKDFTMTIVDFELFPEMDYTASIFSPYNGDLLDGGVLSIFMNKGEAGNAINGAGYELETCSPILELNPNEQFCHIARTYQLRGDKDAIAEICERFFNVSIETLTEFDESSR